MKAESYNNVRESNLRRRYLSVADEQSRRQPTRRRRKPIIIGLVKCLLVTASTVSASYVYGLVVTASSRRCSIELFSTGNT